MRTFFENILIVALTYTICMAVSAGMKYFNFPWTPTPTELLIVWILYECVRAAKAISLLIQMNECSMRITASLLEKTGDQECADILRGKKDA